MQQKHVITCAITCHNSHCTCPSSRIKSTWGSLCEWMYGLKYSTHREPTHIQLRVSSFQIHKHGSAGLICPVWRMAVHIIHNYRLDFFSLCADIILYTPSSGMWGNLPEIWEKFLAKVFISTEITFKKEKASTQHSVSHKQGWRKNKSDPAQWAIARWSCSKKLWVDISTVCL